MTSPSACLVHNNCNARGLENLIAHCFCSSWLTTARSLGNCIAVPRLFQLSACLIVMIMYDLHTDNDDQILSLQTCEGPYIIDSNCSMLRNFHRLYVASYVISKYNNFPLSLALFASQESGM